MIIAKTAMEYVTEIVPDADYYNLKGNGIYGSGYKQKIGGYFTGHR